MYEEVSNAERAEILTQALPYIRRYNGKIVVVKYGGNAMINETLKMQVMEDIVLLWLVGDLLLSDNTHEHIVFNACVPACCMNHCHSTYQSIANCACYIIVVV